MAIYKLLQNTAFLPEDIELMIDAYEGALTQLGLPGGVASLNETIAQNIIACAQTGEKDPQVMCTAALKAIGKAA